MLTKKLAPKKMT